MGQVQSIRHPLVATNPDWKHEEILLIAVSGSVRFINDAIYCSWMGHQNSLKMSCVILPLSEQMISWSLICSYCVEPLVVRRVGKQMASVTDAQGQTQMVSYPLQIKNVISLVSTEK